MKFGDFNEGEVIAVDKPLGWTSTKVVRRLKWLTRARRVGHAGTLDPLATGLLIVCTGKATKTIQQIQDSEKEYTGTIVLGATTATYDREFAPDKLFPWEHITPEMVQQTALSFIGQQQQVPPKFSAVKIGGKRSYERARAGHELVMPPRVINIKELEITRIMLPEVDFRVVCSKGTYIRSLAFDFGQRLHSGAYLGALCRTRVGKWSIADAYEMEILIDLLTSLRNKNEAI